MKASPFVCTLGRQVDGAGLCVVTALLSAPDTLVFSAIRPSAPATSYTATLRLDEVAALVGVDVSDLQGDTLTRVCTQLAARAAVESGRLTFPEGTGECYPNVWLSRCY